MLRVVSAVLTPQKELTMPTHRSGHAVWSMLILLAAPVLGCATDVETGTQRPASKETTPAGTAPAETSTAPSDDGVAPAAPEPSVTTDPNAEPTNPAPPTKPEVHGPQVLKVSYEVQQTGYWCGPAATRVAISAQQAAPSQGTLASELGTTVNGTDYIGQVTRVLNAHVGGYKTRDMPNDPPLPAQRDALWTDLVRSIDNGRAVVANIVAPPSNHPPGYPNETIYHYIAVIGYNPDTREVYIADSANFGGNKLYWITFQQLATLVPPKGYSAWFQ